MRSEDPLQIAFVGTYPPSRCGIGTFTHDLSDAVMTADEGIGATVLAMTAADFDSEYAERVRFPDPSRGPGRLRSSGETRQRRRHPAGVDPARVWNLRRAGRRVHP